MKTMLSSLVVVVMLFAGCVQAKGLSYDYIEGGVMLNGIDTALPNGVRGYPSVVLREDTTQFFAGSLAINDYVSVGASVTTDYLELVNQVFGAEVNFHLPMNSNKSDVSLGLGLRGELKTASVGARHMFSSMIEVGAELMRVGIMDSATGANVGEVSMLAGSDKLKLRLSLSRDLNRSESTVASVGVRVLF